MFDAKAANRSRVAADCYTAASAFKWTESISLHGRRH
jgi:hypothetical protein